MKIVLYCISFFVGLFAVELFYDGFSSDQSINSKITQSQIKNAKKELGKILRSALTDDSNIIIQKNYSTEEFGSLTPLVTLVKESIEFSNQEEEELNRAIEDVDLERILSFENLSHLESIQESLKRLKNFEQRINEIESRRDLLLSKIDSEIDLFAGDYSEKKSIIESYNHSKHQSLIFMNEFYRIQREVNHEIQYLLIFLAEIHDSYVVEEETIYFEEDEHIERYNAYVSRIFELGDEEENLLKSLESYTQSKFKLAE